MNQDLKVAIEKAVTDLYAVDVQVVLSRPDEQFGDYATNVALQLAKPVGQPPRAIAEALAVKIRENLSTAIREVTVAGPGFINMSLTDSALIAAAQTAPVKTLEGQTIVAEFSDPNPFKVLHAGHLYTSVVGDAIANLLQHAGASVHRVNFGGDVGLHVGKTLWAIIQELGGENPDKLAQIPEGERSEWMSRCYVIGNNTYDDNEAAKAEMIALNKRVYQIHTSNDHDSPLAHIYWTCRDWSYQYFDEFYKSIGLSFEKYYPESSVADLGLATVKEQLTKGVFSESNGAVVFEGEPYGLHTRVFINSEGIPTYESKDVGLILQKYEDYHFDRSIVITANEQEQYMQVVLKAVEQFRPELVQATTHLTHGLVKLAGGVKMSSRKGNILRAVDILKVAAEANREVTGKDNPESVLGAVKYAFLKQRTGADIVYDPKESVAIIGNTGPYLQYAHARACSILAKADTPAELEQTVELMADERSLVRQISLYHEALEAAIAELMPHHICTYLYELAQTFNRFYEKNRVIGDAREALRLQLVAQYAKTLNSGLQLLGIPAPDKM